MILHKVKHLGLIPDGTRRWAKMNHVGLPEAYHRAVGQLANLIDCSMAFVDELSIYLLSKENLKRSASELDAVVEEEIYLFEDLLPALCQKHSIKAVHAGKRSGLPGSLQHALEVLCDETRGYRNKRINLLVGYHPFDEINDAISRCGGNLEIKHLWVQNELDLVIRTGGGSVPLSNFLPLQCGYSSFAMVDDYFNDFTEEQLLKIYHETLAAGMMMGR